MNTKRKHGQKEEKVWKNGKTKDSVKKKKEKQNFEKIQNY